MTTLTSAPPSARKRKKIFQLRPNPAYEQAHRLVFARVGPFSVETDQAGVIRTFSLLICLFIHIINCTRNTIRRYMARPKEPLRERSGFSKRGWE